MEPQDDPRVQAYFRMSDAMKESADYQYDTPEWTASIAQAQLFATIATIPLTVIHGVRDVKAARKLAQDEAHIDITEALKSFREK